MTDLLLNLARIKMKEEEEEEEEQREGEEEKKTSFFTYMPTVGEIIDKIITDSIYAVYSGTERSRSLRLPYTLGEIILHETALKKNIILYIIQFSELIDKLVEGKFTRNGLIKFLNGRDLAFYRQVYNKMILGFYGYNEEWGLRNIFPSKLNLIRLYNSYNSDQIILENVLQDGLDRTHDIRSIHEILSKIVISGRFENSGKEVIVKFTSGGPVQQYFKIMKIYQTIKSAGVRTTKMYKHYRLMGVPAIVMEKVIIIPYRGDPNLQMEVSMIADMGIQLLGQLRLLHEIALHLDIKPDNIAYRINPKTGEKEFMFIDLDDISMIKMGVGFKRITYTPLFTSQVSDNFRISTRENDILELLYTLNAFLKINYVKEIESRNDLTEDAKNTMIERQIKEFDNDFIPEILEEIILGSESKVYPKEDWTISMNLTIMRHFLNMQAFGKEMTDIEEDKFYSTLQNYLRPFLTSQKIIS